MSRRCPTLHLIFLLSLFSFFIGFITSRNKGMENITFYFISPRQILLNKKRKRKKRKKATFSLLLYSIVIPFSMLGGGGGGDLPLFHVGFTSYF